MKFEQLKQSLRQEVKPIYYLYGEDEFLKTNAINLICAEVNNFDKLNTITLNAEDIDAKKFSDTCNTFGFFGKKVVILKDSDSKKNSTLVEAVKDYVKSPNLNSVLIIVESFDNQNFESVKSLVEEVDCNRLSNIILQKWIINKTKGKVEISVNAIKKLIDYCNGYLSKINLELEKLISYCNTIIAENDIELLVTKDLEYNIFEFTESLGKGDKTKALKIYNDLMQDKKLAPTILNLISSHFRRLFYVAITKLSLEEISGYLKIKPYAVKKLYEQSVKFSPIVLKNIVEQCEKLDTGIKTGEYNYFSATNYLINFILASGK